MQEEAQIWQHTPCAIMVFEPKLLDNNSNYSFRLDQFNSTAQNDFALNERSNTNFLHSIFHDPEATDLYKACIATFQSGRTSTKILNIKIRFVAQWMQVKVIKLDQKIAMYLQRHIEITADTNELNKEDIKYRELFETSLDAIFLAVDNFNITSVNPKFCATFKYNAEDIDTLQLKNIFKQESTYNNFVDLLAQRKFVEEFEAELLTIDGETRYCVINAIPVLEANQELLVYQGVIRDMTSRREAEQQLIIAEKLTLTGRLARSIAHEVRNPLTNIRLAIDQFKEEIPTSVEDAEFYLDMIGRNTDRISNLITDLMNSSKQKKLELEKLHVNDVLSETIELIQDRINLKEIAIETNLSESLPQVFLDRNQTKIAFLNILLNAIEAMVANTGILKLRTFAKGKHIFIEVGDNGKGIPAEELENLFEPFYTGRKDGSGLGLTTTRNIVHAHHGSIKVQSAPGVGTTFSIAFSVEVSAEQIFMNEKN